MAGVAEVGAANVKAAYQLYGGKVPAQALCVLVYMSVVAKDSDPTPMFWEGHAAIAEMCLGRAPAVDDGKGGKTHGVADLRAVERAITPLYDAGAITRDRASAGRAGKTNLTVRYRLWLTSPAPDEKRRAAKPDHPTKTGGCNEQHPTKSDRAPDENRWTKEQEEDLKQERRPEAKSGHPHKAETSSAEGLQGRNSTQQSSDNTEHERQRQAAALDTWIESQAIAAAQDALAEAAQL